MKESVRMVFDDPSKFHLLPTQVKLDITQGALATVNQMAGRGRKEAIKNVKANFINRNAWTLKQIQFTPMPESKYVKLDAIQATLGATEKAPYMKRQEEGGKHTPTRGKTLAIPTDYARGGNIRRLVAPSMRLGRITKRRRVNSSNRFKSRKAAKVATAFIAFKRGLFLPFGDTNGQRNLFVVTEFHKKGRKGVAFRLKQVYKFDQPETNTKPAPWLLPASEKVARQVQAIFNSQMKKIER